MIGDSYQSLSSTNILAVSPYLSYLSLIRLAAPKTRSYSTASALIYLPALQTSPFPP